MAKYEYTITLEPRPADGGGVRGVTDPTLDEVRDAVQTGAEAVFGDDFEVKVNAGNRPDVD